MKILFLSFWYPYPPSNGSKIRIYNLLRVLAQKHEIHLITFNDEPKHQPDTSELGKLCREVVVIPRKRFNPWSMNSFKGLFSRIPRVFIDTYSPEMAESISRMVAKESFDLVIANAIGTAVYNRYFSGLKAVFEEVEIGVPYEKYFHSTSMFQRLRNGLTWLKHRKFMEDTLDAFEFCTVVSENEHRLLSETVPAYQSIEVIPNFVNLDDYHHVDVPAEQDRMIFSGSFQYAPNYHGLRWFIDEAFSELEAQFPALRLYVTGNPAGISLGSQENIIQTGFVDDIHSMVARSWVNIVPILVGGGTRLKIIESMALGTPVVSTSKGAEGLDVSHGENILIADTPVEFGAAVCSVLRDADLRRRLSEGGQKLVAAKYSSALVGQRLDALLDRYIRKAGTEG